MTIGEWTVRDLTNSRLVNSRLLPIFILVDSRHKFQKIKIESCSVYLLFKNRSSLGGQKMFYFVCLFVCVFKLLLY